MWLRNVSRCPRLTVVTVNNDLLSSCRDLPELLTVPEACRQLSLSRSELYRKMGKGEIRSIHHGPRQRRVPKTEVLAYIKRKMAEEMPPGGASGGE